MFKGATKSRVVLTAAIAAMWLTACGGGGGGGDPVAASPAPAPATGQGPGAPAPAPGPGAPAPQALSWSPAVDAAGSSIGAQRYHWTTTNRDGTVMAAGVIPGTIYVSTDSGATWTASGPTLPNANWISVKMTDDASLMVAVAFEGAMYTSINQGQDWTRVDSAFNTTGSLGYESVAMSSTGTRIVAVTMQEFPSVDKPIPNPETGYIYTSVNGGASFVRAGGSAAAQNVWRAVDSTPDGMVVVAVTQHGGVHLSTDGGLTFSELPQVATVDGPVTDGWYRVKISDDGDTIAMAGNPFYSSGGSGLYMTTDRGVTWTRASAVTGPYTSVAMSGNGSTIMATISDIPADPNVPGSTATPGTVLLSTNGGQSFAVLPTQPAETNWRNIALNQAGTRAVLAAGTFYGATGGLYTSNGSLTGQ